MIKSVLDKVEITLKYICGIFMVVIVVVLFYAVIMRYVFHNPPGWSLELGRYMFLWMVMLGAVLVTRERSHIQITFVVNLFPPMIKLFWINILRIIMIWFCWVMIQQGFAIYPTVSEASSPALGISMGWLYLSVPVAGFLIALYLIESVIESILYRIRVGTPREETTC